MLGQLYARQNRIEEAKTRFQDVLKRDPKSRCRRTMLAMLLEGQGRTEEAEKEYRHILALDSQAAVAANNLAWIYVAGNRNLDEALQAQTAHQALPGEAQVTDTLRWLRAQEQRLACVEQLEACARKMPKESLCPMHLSASHVMKAGDFDKARQALAGTLAQTRFRRRRGRAKSALTTMGV